MSDDWKAQWEAAKAKAKAMTDTEISAALEEMRDRGAAIAYYGAGEFKSMFDGDLVEDWDGEAWMEENRDDIEEVMSEAARAYFLREADDAFSERSDDHNE